MVNFGLNAAAILGLFLAVAGAGLFFLRSIRPELARDYDIFFAAVGLLCGIILLFNGWRLDPILQFGQFLLTGTSIFFAFESIRMRGVATEQARRNTPTVDRDRPVSRTRVYTEAELDKIDPYDSYDNTPNYNSPRLRGYDDPQPRSVRRSTEPRRSSTPPSMDVRDEPRRTSSRNRPETNDYPSRDSDIDNRSNYNDRPSRPRRRPSPEATDAYDSWNANDEWDDNSNFTPRSRPRPRPSTDENSEDPTPTVSRRRQNPADLGRTYQDPQDDYDAGSVKDNRDFNRPSDDLGRSYQDEDKSTSIPGDYVVDYQPIENLGTDYTDDYDDLGEDDDNYNNNQDDNTDDYQDYQRPSGKRQPINFNDYE